MPWLIGPSHCSSFVQVWTKTTAMRPFGGGDFGTSIARCTLHYIFELKKTTYRCNVCFVFSMWENTIDA